MGDGLLGGTAGRIVDNTYAAGIGLYRNQSGTAPMLSGNISE